MQPDHERFDERRGNRDIALTSFVLNGASVVPTF